MTFDRKKRMVTVYRARARKLGCKDCLELKEVGLKNKVSLAVMVREGASVFDLKAAMQEDGWYCRKCVRKWNGTAAASTSTNLRDRFPVGPKGQRQFMRYRMERCREAGQIVEWLEDECEYTAHDPDPVTGL